MDNQENNQKLGEAESFSESSSPATTVTRSPAESDERQQPEDELRLYRKIAGWGKFSGIMLIISGVLSTVGGLFAFIVGAAPGVLQIFIGIYLLKSATAAGNIEADQKSYKEMLDYYAKYVQMTGILMIIGIAIFVVALIFLFVVGVAFYQESNHLYF